MALAAATAAVLSLSGAAEAQVPQLHFQSPHGGPAWEGYAGPNPRAMVNWGQTTYVCGTRKDSSTLKQIALWSYDASGAMRWASPATWPPSTEMGEFHGITVEYELWDAVTMGPIYVAGVGPGSGSGLDTYLACFDDNGNHVWTGVYNSNTNLDDLPVRILHTVSDCDVYVVGTTVGAVSGTDYYIARFDKASGALLEVLTFDGGYGLQDKAVDAVSRRSQSAGGPDGDQPPPGSGNSPLCNPPPQRMAFITGTAFSPTTAEDFFTVAVNLGAGCTGAVPAMSHWWSQTYHHASGPTKAVDAAASIALVDGDVVLTGSSQANPSTGSTGFDYLTIRYRYCDGLPVWPTPNRWNGPGNSNDIARRVAGPLGAFAPEPPNAAEHNYIYVTGGTHSNEYKYDVGTIAIDWDTGQLVWDHVYRLANVAADDFGQDVAATVGEYGGSNLVSDRTGGVYVTARGVDAQGKVNYVTYRLKRRPSVLPSPLPPELARMQWPSPYVEVINSGMTDVPTTIGISRKWILDLDRSDIFVTGRSPAPDDAATVRYRQDP